MKMWLLFFLFFLAVTTDCQRSSYSFGCDPNYYWRDYYGKVPSDAIAGGRNQGGIKFYVGQAYFPNQGIVPVQIFQENAKVSTSFKDKSFETQDNIKILCGTDSDYFVWAKITTEQIKLLTDSYLIPGGFYTNSTLYVGRVFYNNHSVIGRVFPDSSPSKGFWYKTVNETEQNYFNFDILLYSCTKTAPILPVVQPE